MARHRSAPRHKRIAHTSRRRKATRVRSRPADTKLLVVRLGELGRKDASFDTLEAALAELRSRHHAKVRVGAWSKPKRVTHYGFPVTYQVAKWSQQASPRSRTAWAKSYDGKLVRYFTSEPASEHHDMRRRMFG